MVDDCVMGTMEVVVDERRSPTRRVWRRVGRRADGRSPLWIELAIIVWLFWLYDVINNLAPLRQALAIRNAQGIISFERSLHIDVERTLNRWLASHHLLATPAVYYYFFAHGVVTFGVLVWLWLRRPARYPRLRAQLVIVNLIAFVVFWRYPLAPPRMFPRLGYQDVVAAAHAVVSWRSAALVHNADQLAAMPSLHIAWASWSGWAVWQVCRRPAVRVVAVAYPLLTAVIVVATGNHYVLDVLAGGAALLTAIALQRAGEWLLALRRRKRPVVAATAERTVHPERTNTPAARSGLQTQGSETAP